MDDDQKVSLVANGPQVGGGAGAMDCELIWIRDVTPDKKNFKVKGRVIRVSGLQMGSTGPFFHFDLHDAIENGAIRYLAFDQIAIELSKIVRIDSVYQIENPYVMEEKSSITGHKFQLRSNKDYRLKTRISPVVDDKSVPPLHVNKHEDIDLPEADSATGVHAEPNTLLTFRNEVVAVSPVRDTASRLTGQPLKLREVLLKDENGAEVILSLWNRHALDFDAEPGAIIIAKDVAVKEYNGELRLTGSQSFCVQEVAPRPQAAKLEESPDQKSGSPEAKRVKEENEA